MNYFFLKLGQGNSEIASLSSRKPTASVYFDAKGKKAYESGLGQSQPRAFWEVGNAKNRGNTVMVVIHRAELWLLRPAGVVRFSKKLRTDSGGRSKEKKMPVELLVHRPSKYVPTVLASMACNQKYARRTFTEIDHWGNLKAIDWVLDRFNKDRGRRYLPVAGQPECELPDHWRASEQRAAQLIECLGSTELETLIAKLLEANGCHVPAHRGGTLGEIDLFAWNDSSRMIRLDRLLISPGQRTAIQVKSWADGQCRPPAVDYLIGIGVKGNRAFDENWILAQVRNHPDVCRWMLHSLEWLPRWFLELPQFQLGALLPPG